MRIGVHIILHMTKVSSKLKQSRLEAGLSQGELAKLAGLGPNQISRYERGEQSPSLDTLEKILAALNISFEDFFNAVHLDALDTMIEQQVDEVFRDQGTSLSPRRRQDLINLAKSNVKLAITRTIEGEVAEMALTPKPENDGR